MLSLRWRMIFGVALLVTLVAAGSAALCTRVAQLAMINQFNATMQALAENLARNAAHAVYIEGGEALGELADALMEQQDVLAVSIFNVENEPILRTDPKRDETDIGVVPAPVYFNAESEASLGPFPGETIPEGAPQIIGRVEVTYSRVRLERELAAVRWRVWVMAAIAGFVGVLGAAVVSTRMIRPLNAMTRATETIAGGELNVRVETRRGSDELARLAANFNKMAQALQENQRELKETYAELARKDRLATLGEFTAVIAHELRNPLGIILSSAQVVSNPDRPPEMKEKAARFIIDEVRRLNEDLTAFLNFARPKPADMRNCDPDKLLARAAESFRQRTTRASGERPTGGDNLQVEVAPNGASRGDVPEVLADPDQLHQALLNLLFNASQALGSEGGRIVLSVDATGDAVELHVDDNGPGIPPEARQRLFEPFFTTKKKGTGLGLAVVDQIITAHGGSIVAGESPAGGARFTIRLPSADSTSTTRVQ